MNMRGQKYLGLKELTIDDDNLKVTFVDGKYGWVSVSALTPDDRENVEWSNARVTAHGLKIVVPAEPTDLQISWHAVRSLIDQDFARLMAERAAEQSQHIGRRLRQLREQRSLTQKEVALRAGLEPANLSRIENGHVDISASSLWKILAAMGCSPSDLASEPVRQVAAD